MNTPPPTAGFTDSFSESVPAAGRALHDLIINVLGTSFSITAGESPAYLDEVLAQYKIAVANTQNISGMQDPLKVAILTGFLLCDEINKLKLQSEEEQAQAEARQAGEANELNRITKKIIARIDRAFEEAQTTYGNNI